MSQKFSLIPENFSPIQGLVTRRQNENRKRMPLEKTAYEEACTWVAANYAQERISGPERSHISGETQPGANGWSGVPRGNTESTTLGWHPTCTCPPERNTGAGRCIVLDPFAGTCTVGKVAVKHGRRFVGLELKPEYIELARERTHRTQMVMQV